MGKRNYKFFFMFLVSLSIYCCYLFAFVVTHLAMCKWLYFYVAFRFGKLHSCHAMLLNGAFHGISHEYPSNKQVWWTMACLKNELATFVGQCHIDKAYKYRSLPTHMDQKKSHLSTIRDMSYIGWLWGMVGGKAKCLQRCIISETTQSVCLCMQLPGYWLFVFLHIVSQGEEESFISAMKQSPARYPLKYYNYMWLSKPSLQILSWTTCRLWCNLLKKSFNWYLLHCTMLSMLN